MTPLDPDDRIEVAFAEQLPWPDGAIDLGVTSPPYCLGEAVPYADGGDYADYEHYRQILVPAWCAQLYRVGHPAHGRWCVNVPLDTSGPGSRDGRDRAPVQANGTARMALTHRTGAPVSLESPSFLQLHGLGANGAKAPTHSPLRRTSSAAAR